MKHIYTNITKGILTAVIVLTASVAAFAGNVIIASGTTANYTTFMDGTVIEVHGTLSFDPSYNNGLNNQVIVYSGGVVNMPASVKSIYNVLLDIRNGGTLNIAAPNFSMSSTTGITGIINAGTVNATKANITLNNGSNLENSGEFNMKSLTVNAASSAEVKNKNTGTMTLTGALTVNGSGNYENTASGVLTVGGAFTNNGDMATSGTMSVGGALTNNGDLTISGTMTVEGKATVNSAITLNGSLTVAGDLVVNGPITGTNGTLTVTDGKSTMNGGGSFTGTNMRFNDVNTGSHNFDVNYSATKATNQYALGAAPQSAPPVTLPLRFLSFDAVDYNSTTVYFTFTTTVEASLSNIQLQGSNDGKNYTAIENFTPHNSDGIFNYRSASIASSRFTSYRLAVIDLDGTKEYSKTIFFKSSAVAGTTEAGIFPNPVINAVFNVKVTSAEPAIINIFTSNGSLLSSTTLKGQQQYQVTMPASAGRNNMVAIQVIQNGKINAFTVLNK